MRVIILGILLILAAILFNRAGNSRLQEPVDVSEYYNYASVAYFAGIILVQMGCIIKLIRFINGI